MGQPFQLTFEQAPDFTYSPETIDKLSEYEKYELSYHPERPKYLDYLTIFSAVEPCFESDTFGNCLIQTHRAEMENIPVMLIGQQSGPSSDYSEIRKALQNSDEVTRWNHGMPVPASYERAIKAVKLADQERRAIIIFVDTPGADPTEESEANGIAWRIGDTIHALADVNVPTLSLIINRACSGGAIALTGCDVTLAMEYSTYLVITPEACSSILFRTRSRANEAAAASQITSKEGFVHGIIDEIVPEPKGPAHRFKKEALDSAQRSIAKYLHQLKGECPENIFEQRVERWSRIGQWNEMNDREIRSIQKHISQLPTSDNNGYLKRHPGCYDIAGNHIYDPVNLEELKNENFVCGKCGHRYIRPSAWDYLDWILDNNSFVEHKETRMIIDKDILAFPDYSEKLKIARERTGLTSAMITGDGTVHGKRVVVCSTDFGFFGGSFCMSTGEKVWRAIEIAIERNTPVILQVSGGGARMNEGCSSMVSIPKVHVAISRAERAGLPVITLVTDPTLGGVAIGIGSRGVRLFEKNAGNIGFSGKRVIEQYTGRKTSKGFQTVEWLRQHEHADIVVAPQELKQVISQYLT